MQNIRLIIYLTLLLIAAQTATAQEVVPGFYGKRYFVEGSFAFIPTLAGINQYHEKAFSPPYKYGFPISWRGGVGLHYINGRRKNLFLSYDLVQTGVKATLQTPVPEQYKSSSGDKDIHTLFSQLDVHILSFGQEYMAGGYLAPIGAYSRLSLQGLLVSSTILDKTTDFASTNIPREVGQHQPLGIDDFKTWDIGLGVEFGYRYAIAKKFFINTSLGTNINFRGLFKSFVLLEGTNNSDSNQDNYENQVLTRLGYHSLFLLKVGLAYPF